MSELLKVENITLDGDSIIIDGHRINGKAIAAGVRVHHGGDNEVGPSVTLTIHADTVTITGQAEITRAGNPGMYTETGHKN